MLEKPAEVRVLNNGGRTESRFGKRKSKDATDEIHRKESTKLEPPTEV